MAKFFDPITNLFSSLFGGGDKPQAPPAPVLEPPTPMPMPDDEAVAAAKRRSIAAQMQRSGRQSTLLTSDPVTGETLG